MTDREPTALSEIVDVLDSAGLVSLQRVYEWMTEDDDEVLGALYILLRDHAQRVVPVPPTDLSVQVLLKIVRVSEVRPGLRNFGMSPYEAAALLLSEAVDWNTRRHDDDSAHKALLLLRERMAEMYRSGDAKTRRRIVDGFLEHAFEVPSLRVFFHSWKDMALLSQAYAEAAQWADNQQ
jgi:hypothetical protein